MRSVSIVAWTFDHARFWPPPSTRRGRRGELGEGRNGRVRNPEVFWGPSFGTQCGVARVGLRHCGFRKQTALFSDGEYPRPMTANDLYFCVRQTFIHLV